MTTSESRPVTAPSSRQTTSAQTSAESRPLTQGAARIGLVAKGLMYLLLGVVVAQLAWPGPGGRSADQEGALRTLASQPAGRLLLAVLAVGFAAYAIWQLQCLRDGYDTKARVTAALRGLLWGGAAVTAARMVLRAGASGNQEQSITATLLAAPFGPWLVAAIGGAIIVVGVVMLRRLRGDGYLKDLRPLSPQTRRFVSITAAIGISARTMVFMLAGAFLVRAALVQDPERGVGLDAALSEVARQSYGPYVLTGTAAGLGAYAAWCLVRARYEDVERSDG